MYRRWHHKVQLYYALLDVAVVFGAFFAAYGLRSWINENEFVVTVERYFEIPGHTRLLLEGFAVATWIAVGVSFRIYENIQLGRWRRLVWDALRQTVTTTTALILFQFLLRLDLSRFFLALFTAFALLIAVTIRVPATYALGWWLGRFGTLRHVLIAGTGAHARKMAQTLADSPGIQLNGFLAVKDPAPEEMDVAGRTLPVYRTERLAGLLRQHIIDEIIFAVDSRDLGDLEEVFLLCDEEGVRTRLALDFFPHVNSRVYLDHLTGKPLLTFAAAPDDELRLLVKRLADILVAGTALVVLAPAMAAIAALIRITSPGPVIFRQERCGLNGRRFTMYKFRSMVSNAEELKASVQHLSVKGVAFKVPNDPRLTPIGGFLRRFSIDEWPQLWNVLIGDMSLVGPRPAVPGEVEKYEQWQRRRLRMRPGLTCLWTLEGRDALDFPTWMRLDLQYIDNWSLAQDARILLYTIPVVLTGRNAY